MLARENLLTWGMVERDRVVRLFKDTLLLPKTSRFMAHSGIHSKDGPCSTLEMGMGRATYDLTIEWSGALTAEQNLSSFCPTSPLFYMPNSSGTQWLLRITTYYSMLFLKVTLLPRCAISSQRCCGASNQGEVLPQSSLSDKCVHKDTILFMSVNRCLLEQTISTQNWLPPGRKDILGHWVIHREAKDRLFHVPSACPEYNLIIWELREKQWEGEKTHYWSFLLLKVQMACSPTASYWKALWKLALENHKVESECAFYEIL